MDFHCHKRISPGACLEHLCIHRYSKDWIPHPSQLGKDRCHKQGVINSLSTCRSDLHILCFYAPSNHLLKENYIYYINSVKHVLLHDLSFPGWHRGKLLRHFQRSTVRGVSQLLDKLSYGLGAGILLRALLMGQIPLMFHRDYLLCIQETFPLPSALPQTPQEPAWLLPLPSSRGPSPGLPEGSVPPARAAPVPQGLTLETKVTDCIDAQLLRGLISNCLACFTRTGLKLSF